MLEAISVNSPFGMIVAIVLICTLGGVVSTVVGHVRKFIEHQQDLDFKRDMIERGLNIEEIERLIFLARKDA